MLSTIGKGVFDGNGVADGKGVSVETSVGVTEAVSVGARGVNVFVSASAVLVGNLVSTGVGIDDELQANEVSINRIGKTSFRLIG